MNSNEFEYTSFPTQVFFGKNRLTKLSGLLANYQKAFIIASPRLKKQVEKLALTVGQEKLLHFDDVVQHVPTTLVTKALAEQKNEGTDLLIALGGGSAIGLAKAMALTLKHDIVAVPTTYAGSEMTNIWGISSEGRKTTGRDPVVQPKYVIYDPQLTENMPKELAVKSAMNAMAHLMEAVYAHDSNPITYTNSLLGIEKLTQGMNEIRKTQNLSQKANELFLFGSFLGGKSLGEVAMSLHHKAAHTLGGSFGMDHASVHTVLQAYVLDHQWDALSNDVQEDFKKVFHSEYPPKTLQTLAKGMDAPTMLTEIGFKETDVEKAVDLMLLKPYANPKPLEKKGLMQMLKNACLGIISN